VFRDDMAEGEAQPGELVPVADPAGTSLGWGLYSSSSRIALRMVTRSEAQPTREFWAERVQRAVAWRQRAGLLLEDGACRLIGGDADGIPGLVVDRYARVLVLQSGIQASDRMRDFLLELILEALPFEIEAVLDRSDASVRRLEELEARVELVSGKLDGPVQVREENLTYAVDVEGGQKTGAYLDQRENRLRAAALVADGTVLDAFAYDGLFGIHAALAGARRVVCLEQSRTACERIVANARANGVEERVEVVRTDCMKDLRARAEAGESYDMIVVDPPPFARNRREVDGAERGYVELNRRAALMLGETGRLVTASCSYNVLPETFLVFLRSAARLAQREFAMTGYHGAACDHPELLSLPESRYLKCAFLARR
jgi:23S rRNA (cytosine1962-C5)-methyltransferase